MQRRQAMAVALTLLVAVVLTAGCGGDSSEIVARVGSKDITRADLNRRLSELPPFSQQEFSGPEGVLRLLDRMVEEEVLYQAALEKGYARDPEVLDIIEKVTRRAMIQTFYEKEIEGTLVIPEEDIVEFYETSEVAQSDWFNMPARVRFRHIVTRTQAEARRARDRVLSGEPFTDVARDVSIDDKTREAGGLVRTIDRGLGAPDLGIEAELVDQLFAWENGEVTEPLRSKLGWHIVQIEDKREAGRKPLEMVRDTIIKSLRPQHMNRHYEATMEDLRASFGATVNEAAFRRKVRSEEELFTLAQDTEDATKRLSYYSELVYNYPEGEHADEAQFMIGFIQAEELGNTDAARNALERMLQNYPDSELSDSASWLLENLESEPPAFEDEEEAPE